MLPGTDWEPPIKGPLLDVPVQRETIGGMLVAAGTWAVNEYAFKPYVYRGTGEDQFPETPERPAPPPKSKAVTVEDWRSRERANEVARIKYRARKERQARQRAESRRRRLDLNLINTVRTVLDPPDPRYDRLVMHPEVGDDPDDEPQAEQYQAAPYRNLRPAAGWRPMLVSDIDELLAEIGE